MLRTLLAAVVSLALAGAGPVRACENCDKCPHKVAAADAKNAKDAKKDKKPAACACDKDGKGCKCGPGCQCAHCSEHGKKGEAKPEGTKS